MITIDLGTIEQYDAETNTFEYIEGGVVRFEYSLKVMYEWEAKWKKPFLKNDVTEEEIKDFYYMMALDPMDREFLTIPVIHELAKYIGDSQTATTFSNHSTSKGSGLKGKIYTAEELYALMFMAGIPIEFENRNLNRLLVVLRVINNYQTPPKKMTKEDIYKQNAQLNAERKKALQTKG